LQFAFAMAKTIILSAVALAVIYITYSKITLYLYEKRFKAFAEQNGCREPPMAPSPQGFQRLRRMM